MRVILTSPWIPVEWVRAHGLDAQGIWFAEKFRQAVPPLSAGTCAFAESVVQFAGSRAGAAFVFTTACDQLRRGFDEVFFRDAAGVFLFNLPATQTPAARRIYHAEMERLGQFLQGVGGAAPPPEKLQAEMAVADQVRRSLRAAAPSAEPGSFVRAIARFYADGSFSSPAPARPEGRVPLAMIGGPLSRADWPLFDAIETAGGLVVLNATDTGERILCPAFQECKDPFASLADGYFDNLADVFQRPNARLYSWLKPRLLARRVRGLVLWCFTSCDLWRAEMQTLRETFRLPLLLLEVDGGTGLSARDANRLQAFVETLK